MNERSAAEAMREACARKLAFMQTCLPDGQAKYQLSHAEAAIRSLSLPEPAAPAEIAKMREPTEAMLNAARDWSVKKYGLGIGNDAAIGCWQAMFDVAEINAERAASDPAEIATAETLPSGIVLKIAGKPVCSWGIGQGGYQAEGLAAEINAALAARQSRAETALARAVGPEWAARILAGEGEADPRGTEIERLKAHVARLDEAFNRSDKRQIWQDGFSAAKELALSVRVGAFWGPKATPDDGIELALKAIKRVFERSRHLSMPMPDPRDAVLAQAREALAELIESADSRSDPELESPRQAIAAIDAAIPKETT